MKGYSYLKRAFTWLLTVVITVSYVLPGTAVTAWASEKEEAGEYPLLGYIDDISVLFDGKEAAPGDEFNDLDPEQTYVVSASYQSGDIAEALLDGALAAGVEYKIPLPDVFPVSSNQETLELVLKKNETNAELYDRLGENNHVIGTVTFTFRQAVPATASDSTASRGSFASVRFNRSFVEKIQRLNGRIQQKKASPSVATVSQLSDDEPDEDIIEVSDIWFSFRVSGSVEWSDICSKDVYETVLPFEGFGDISLQFQEPVLDKKEQIKISKEFSFRDSRGAAVWEITAKTTNGAKFPEGTVIRDIYSDNSVWLEDEVTVASDGKALDTEDYAIEAIPEIHGFAVTFLRDTVSPVTMTVKTKPVMDLDAAGAVDKPVTLKNQAGITVGDLALDTADQTYTYPAALLQKTAGEMKNGILPWTLTVNPGGAYLEEGFTISDELNEKLTYSGSFKVYSYEGKDNSLKLTELSGHGITDAYDEESRVLSFDIPEGLDIPLKIVFETAYQEGLNGGETITNVATAYVADHVIRSKPTAGSIPGGQVLSKEGKWDGRQITWSIHINKQEMPQNHVIITDLLPVGQEFTGTVTVSDEGQPGGAVELYRFGGEEPESTMAVELEGKETQLTFTRGIVEEDGEDKGKEYFTIDFGEDFVMEKAHVVTVHTFLNGQDNITGNQQRVYENHVELEADEKKIIMDYDGSVKLTPPVVLKKTGAYDDSTQKLNWTIEVNGGEFLRKGYVLKDCFAQPHANSGSYPVADGGKLKDHTDISSVRIEVREKSSPDGPASKTWHTVLDTETGTWNPAAVSEGFELTYQTGSYETLKGAGPVTDGTVVASAEAVEAMIRNIMNDGTPEVLAFSFGDIDQYFKVTIGTTFRKTAGETINHHDEITYRNRAESWYEGLKGTIGADGLYQYKGIRHVIDFRKSSKVEGKDAILWNININDDKFPVDIENDCDHASFGLAPGLCITDTLPRGMELKDGRITVKKSGQEITMTEGVHYVLIGEPGEQTLIIHIPAEFNEEGQARLADSFVVTYRTQVMTLEGMLFNTPVVYQNAAKWSYNQYVSKETSSSQKIIMYDMSADAGGTGTGLKKAEITKYKADKHGKNRVIFPGVEFTLEKKVDGSWVKVTAARTGDDGKVSFAALNPKTEYRIRETGGYEGYEPSNDVHVDFSKGNFAEDVINYPIDEEPETPPETPPVTEPETPPVTEPETPSVTEPETPSVTEPETPPETEPETPSVTEPETPPVTEPETPPVTEPETPLVTEPETPPVTEPETPPVTEPETPPVTEPETPPVTTPETTPPVSPETPENGGGSSHGNSHNSGGSVPRPGQTGTVTEGPGYTGHTETIPDSEIPLAAMPTPDLPGNTEITIDDGNVPLSGLPKTGERRRPGFSLFIAAGVLGLAGLGLTGRIKRRNRTER
ncbi:doubled motif LPXTG anchor domain-containing protein [Hungatella sp.]|uniref:doubled motif LPXTG anchor domain-containing protein n=1 Tax=Hungatella sp. TaxID=2613924 RepID=UPI002A811A0B|nr:doubled motif LPXTG anchor domain-containing protein [Hungatella sp.]